MGLTRWLMIVPLILAGCADVSYVQKQSPANEFKDYRPENQRNAAVLGVGEPMTARQMRANATLTLKGLYDVDQIMTKLAGTYNVAIRWGNGVRKGKRQSIVMNNLAFNEARAYVEDVYDIQIIREGERRLLVLPSASEARVKNFQPGMNVSLSEALRGLAEQCGFNLVITENKEKINATRVSTSMKDVTCHDAFEALLNPHEMSLINEGDYYTIGGLPQRQWNIALLEPVRAEELEVTYSSNFASQGGEGGGGQTSGGTNKVTVKSERNLWDELENDLNALITSHCPVGTDSDSGALDVGVNTQNPLLPPPMVTLPRIRRLEGLEVGRHRRHPVRRCVGMCVLTVLWELCKCAGLWL